LTVGRLSESLTDLFPLTRASAKASQPPAGKGGNAHQTGFGELGILNESRAAFKSRSYSLVWLPCATSAVLAYVNQIVIDDANNLQSALTIVNESKAFPIPRLRRPVRGYLPISQVVVIAPEVQEPPRHLRHNDFKIAQVAVSALDERWKTGGLAGKEHRTVPRKDALPPEVRQRAVDPRNNNLKVAVPTENASCSIQGPQEIGAANPVDLAPQFQAWERQELIVTDVYDSPGGRRTSSNHFEVAVRERVQQELLENEILAREEERRRIARELHDESGQMMASLLAGLRLIDDAKNLKEAKSQAQTLRKIASSAITELGRLSHGLHPLALDDHGLQIALKYYAKEYERAHKIKVKLKISGLASKRLSRNTEAGLYRIAQEALTNISKHANARTAEILLTVKDGLLDFKIADDGRGFDADSVMTKPSRQHLGLQGMRERASMLGGELSVKSRKGGGTIKTLRIPATFAER